MLLLPIQLLDMWGGTAPTIHTGCDIVVGEPYYFQFEVTGGTAPYTWTLLDGTFPPGLHLSTDGVLSGVPSPFYGFYSFTVEVTDNLGNTATIECSFTGPVAPSAMAAMCICPGPVLVTTLIVTVAAVTTLVKCKLVKQPWTVTTTVTPINC